MQRRHREDRCNKMANILFCSGMPRRQPGPSVARNAYDSVPGRHAGRKELARNGRRTFPARGAPGTAQGSVNSGAANPSFKDRGLGPWPSRKKVRNLCGPARLEGLDRRRDRPPEQTNDAVAEFVHISVGNSFEDRRMVGRGSRINGADFVLICPTPGVSLCPASAIRHAL